MEVRGYNMPKLQDCQFIQIQIDGKVIGGASEEKDYSKWHEGYSTIGLRTFSGPDGMYFDPCEISILVTKDTSALYESVFKKGYKNIVITVVHRGSDEFDQSYEIQRTTYTNCKVFGLAIDMREKLFMDISFTYEDMVEVVFNVPNGANNGLDKIGPIKYSIPEKTLK
jgi:hypothetical protein